MPEQKCHDNNLKEVNLSFFACPNSECADFNHFGADNLSIAEWMGKDKAIRRLYCKTCGHRFSEREGSLMQDTKLNQADVARIIKCLGHGCSVEAVQMDELHGKTVKSKQDREVIKVPKKFRKRLGKKRARHGFIRLWP